jgi:hypothetical protein
MKNIAFTGFQYLARIVGIDLLLAAIVCVALLLVERSLQSFGTWLFRSGIATLVVGLLSVIGSTGITRGGSYAAARTVGEQDIPARTNADLKDETASFSFLLMALGAGVLAILLSQLF